MTKRSKRIIDKNFQLRTTFSIISITTIVLFIVIGIIGINTAYNNKKINLVVNNLKRELKGKSTEHQIAIKNNNTLLKKISKNNFYITTIIILIIFVQAITLYYYLIKITHRISGPVHVINNHIQDIINGKAPEFRGLRENDELKDLYANLIKMIDKLQK